MTAKERLGIVIMGFAALGLVALFAGAIMLARMWVLQ